MKTSLLFPSLLVLTLGCQSTGRGWDSTPTVDNALMAYVPEDDHAALDHASQRRSRITEQLAAARRDMDEVESQLELAEANTSSIEKRVEAARERVEHAREYGSNDELASAQDTRAQAEGALRYHRTKLDYYEALETLAENRVDLLEARSELADARFELAKAQAVEKLDRPIADEVDVDDYHHAVEQTMHEVECARIEALTARERAELYKKLAERSMEDVPNELRFGTLVALDETLESRAYENQEDALEEGEAREASSSKKKGNEG